MTTFYNVRGTLSNMSQYVALRLDDKSYDQLQELVDSGEFGNVSEAIRYCIRMQLKTFKPRSPPPLVIKGRRAGAASPVRAAASVSCHQ